VFLEVQNYRWQVSSYVTCSYKGNDRQDKASCVGATNIPEQGGETLSQILSQHTESKNADAKVQGSHAQ